LFSENSTKIWYKRKKLNIDFYSVKYKNRKEREKINLITNQLKNKENKKYLFDVIYAFLKIIREYFFFK